MKIKYRCILFYRSNYKLSDSIVQKRKH